jgi:hypothetical protein
MNFEAIQKQIDAIVDELKVPLPGYGDPVKPEYVEQCLAFLKLLDPDLPDPDMGADPDGRLTGEWYQGYWDAYVSFSFSGDNVFTNFGIRKDFDYITDQDPAGIAKFISRFVRAHIMPQPYQDPVKYVGDFRTFD